MISASYVRMHGLIAFELSEFDITIVPLGAPKSSFIRFLTQFSSRDCQLFYEDLSLEIYSVENNE